MHTLQDKVDEVNVLASKVKKKVEELDKDNEKAKANKATGPGTANERTRTTITAGLKKKLKELMGDFSDLRSRINEEYREVVERRLKTIKGGWLCWQGSCGLERAEGQNSVGWWLQTIKGERPLSHFAAAADAAPCTSTDVTEDGVDNVTEIPAAAFV